MASSKAASYVSRIRRLQTLKTDDAFCLLEMRHSGFFLLFSDYDKPLLTKSKTSKLYTIPEVTYGDLSEEYFSHELHPEVDSVLLGFHGESEDPIFAWNMVNGDNSELIDSLQERFQSRFVDLRKAVFAAESREAAETIAQGQAKINWHRNNLYSPFSGAKTKQNVAGDHRKCKKTDRIHYPAMSPVGIVLVVDAENDRCILARQPKFAPNMYSCLAGFAEMGETIEETVRREVAEEVGVAVKAVEYVGSQHWPFPASSLMVGCIAVVDHQFSDIEIDGEELEDARWFSRDQVEEAMSRSLNPRLPTRRSSSDIDSDSDSALLANMFVPPPQAIAHHIIKHWLSNRE